MKNSLIWKWLGLSFLGLLLVILAMPTLLGSRWIYEPLVRRLEAGDFRLSVGEIHLRWFSPLILRDLAIQETDGPTLLRIREVRTDRGLFLSLLNGRRIGRLEIVDPNLEIELLTEGSNLTRMIDALQGKLGTGKEPGARPSSPPAFDMDLFVKGLAVRVQQTDRDQPLVVIPPLDLSMAYRAVDGSSKLYLEPTQLLNNVAVTPELMRLGLGYAIPLLAKSAWFDGRVSIATGKFEISLDDPAKSTGSGMITLHEVRSGLEDPVLIQVLDLVARMRGKPIHHELVFIDGSQIEIQVADERVSHRGLKLGLPKIDPRLQLNSVGSVGLRDRSLDLIIDFPVPVEQLARRDDVRELGVPTLKLPIRGSLEAPNVEWSAMRDQGADLLGMIRSRIVDEAPATAAILGGLEGLTDGKADQAIGAAMDLLREVGKARQNRNEPASGEADVLPNTQKEPNPAVNRPIFDALKKLLRDREEQK